MEVMFSRQNYFVADFQSCLRGFGFGRTFDFN